MKSRPIACIYGHLLPDKAAAGCCRAMSACINKLYYSSSEPLPGLNVKINYLNVFGMIPL